jgi:hypothetical protein
LPGKALSFKSGFAQKFLQWTQKRTDPEEIYAMIDSRRTSKSFNYV